MADDEFELYSADAGAIWIKHTSSPRRFCFAIIDRKLEGAVGAEADLEEFDLRIAARAFAEDKARSRGLID